MCVFVCVCACACVVSTGHVIVSAVSKVLIRDRSAHYLSSVTIFSKNTPAVPSADVIMEEKPPPDQINTEDSLRRIRAGQSPAKHWTSVTE